MRITGILLAAGSGSRFGGGKLIHPFGPESLPLALIAFRALQAALDDVVVVVRAGDAAVHDVFVRAGAVIALCADAHEGMGRSLACGVARSPDAAGWVIALGDMPKVRPSTIVAVVDRLRGGASIVVPVHAGQRGHPVGFAAAHGPALRDLRGDQGARNVVGRHADTLVELAVDDPGILADVDTREDAIRLASPSTQA